MVGEEAWGGGPVRSSLIRSGPFWSLQLFSNRDRRSSLLLLGRSGGPR